MVFNPYGLIFWGVLLYFVVGIYGSLYYIAMQLFLPWAFLRQKVPVLITVVIWMIFPLYNEMPWCFSLLIFQRLMNLYVYWIYFDYIWDKFKEANKGAVITPDEQFAIENAVKKSQPYVTAEGISTILKIIAFAGCAYYLYTKF